MLGNSACPAPSSIYCECILSFLFYSINRNSTFICTYIIYSRGRRHERLDANSRHKSAERSINFLCQPTRSLWNMYAANNTHETKIFNVLLPPFHRYGTWVSRSHCFSPIIIEMRYIQQLIRDIDSLCSYNERFMARYWCQLAMFEHMGTQLICVIG